MSVDTALFDSMMADTAVKHERKVARASGHRRDTGTCVAQISMSVDAKQRFTNAAKAHGLQLSGFVRLACDEYIRNHGWE